MLDKLISVGPSQTGPASDAKIDSKLLDREFGTKDLRGSHPNDFKSEFKHQLKKQNRKSEDKNEPQEAKFAERKDSKSDIAQGKKKPMGEEEKPSRGIKKKMVNTETMDPNTVSMLMASQESEVEIPDLEKNLDLNQDINSAVVNVKQSKTVYQNQNEGQQAQAGLAASLELATAQVTPQAEVLPTELQMSDAAEMVKSIETSTVIPVESQTVSGVASDASQELIQQNVTFEQAPELSTQAFLEQAGALTAGSAILAEITSENTSEEILSEGVQTDFQKRIFEALKKDQPLEGAKLNTSSNHVGVQTAQAVAALGMKTESQNEQSSERSAGGGEDVNQFLQTDVMSADKVLHVGNQESFRSHMLNRIDQTGQAVSVRQADDIQDPNIKELLNQAQYLVKKGGGEMNVRMSPEGMGEVQLRVMLDNGRVNIEMNTQDKAVKKLIEDSLSDLKSSLASHHMNVEHVKINNTIAATNTENSTQFQSNMNQDDSNRAQREFWQQTQNQNANDDRARRASYQDVSAVDPVKRAARPEPLAEVRRKAANKYYGNNKGSTLNAVA